MNLQCENYRTQERSWPKSGRHILAQFDDETVVVYQAYRPAIGRFAAKHGYFGGGFSYSRMSWIKPNFLWMMFRSGWGAKADQETTLAIWLQRAAFDLLLQSAVHSAYVPGYYENEIAWKNAVANSDVRLQWDPDHDPKGAKVERRAIQLGLRGDTLAKFGREWIVRIEDISDFVARERENVEPSRIEQLLTPRELVYPVTNVETRRRLGVDVE
jgi:hypothetical protein